MLHEACRQLARWRSDLLQAAGLAMSVNISARQLQDASIVEDVESALKVDQSFVARLDQDAEGRAVVYAVVSLATALGIRVTGEGIETASQLSTLIELDCSHGQSFLLGRPVPPDELVARLRTVNPTEVTVAARLARLQ